MYGKTAIEFPQRIVCLDAGTAGIAHAVGAGNRVVGIPAGAKGFAGAHAIVLAPLAADSVLALEPDLVLRSRHAPVDPVAGAANPVRDAADVVRDDVARVVRVVDAAGVAVVSTHPRSFDDVLRSMLLIGGALGCAEAARDVVQDLRDEVKQIREYSSIWPDRPRVYVALSPDDRDAAAGWVSDLVDIAGGRNVLAGRAREEHPAPDVAGTRDDIVVRDPQIIIVASHGTPLHPDALARRPGIRAGAAGQIHQVPRDDLLVPGPALMLGLRRIHEIIQSFQASLA